VGALGGVSNAVVPVGHLDTLLTYEDLEAVGSGLGSAGFIVLDDAVDLAAVAAGVSRFLAVESCGQCTPCKQDGVALASLLGHAARSTADVDDLAAIGDRIGTVADEARCFLAHQHRRVLEGLLRWFPDALERHLDGRSAAVEPMPVLPIRDLGDDGRFVLDDRHLAKQPDWTYGTEDSGKPPVTRLAVGGPARR
jgi:NADH:ubiquinone oxidoreductase subunit F (NADH-binding)